MTNALPSWVSQAVSGLAITPAQIAAAIASESPGPAYFGKITVRAGDVSVVLHYQNGGIVRLETGRTRVFSDGSETESQRTYTPVTRGVEFRKGG